MLNVSGRSDGEQPTAMNFSANLMIHYSANGTIHFSYSHIHRPQSDDTPAQAFHTRQLSYPVIVTVYHMLECHGMDILPFPSYPSDDRNTPDGSTKERRRDLFVDDEASWCLFSIEVRNTYGLPFEVSFDRTQEGFSKFFHHTSRKNNMSNQVSHHRRPRGLFRRDPCLGE